MRFSSSVSSWMASLTLSRSCERLFPALAAAARAASVLLDAYGTKTGSFRSPSFDHFPSTADSKETRLDESESMVSRDSTLLMFPESSSISPKFPIAGINPLVLEIAKNIAWLKSAVACCVAASVSSEAVSCSIRKSRRMFSFTYHPAGAPLDADVEESRPARYSPVRTAIVMAAFASPLSVPLDAPTGRAFKGSPVVL